MKFRNDVFPTDPAQLAAMAEPGPPGPIVMVNLLKFKEKAEYADGRPCTLTGKEAYALYGAEVARLIMSTGGRILFAGDVSFLSLGMAEPLWDEVALAEYPTRADFARMAMSAAWQAISVHRAAGLAGQLNIECTWKQGLLAMLG
jgi:uncharacterized protein (DUF1330 family)